MRGGSVNWDMSSTCIQGGIPRPLGGYQPNIMMQPSSPAPAWNMHQSVVPKQEPMEEDIRDDSGINSGSDFHSSSPGSDTSTEYKPAFSTFNGLPQTSTFYTSPVTSQPQYPAFNIGGFNPLTPPSIEPMVSPKTKDDVATTSSSNDTTLTPHASPVGESPKSTSELQSNPLHCLEMQFEKNGLLQPSAFSPKTSEHSGDDDNKESWEESEESVRVPTVNSHGKVKTFKCKQCDFVAITKLEFWEHSKAHIKTEKILTCPKCPFVTEYKHHLEYHLRNHFGSKPFKCEKCSYSCVNKSMLNSHMKSHSNIYQYRCNDCSYATKYCHSLKLHLRKYRHQPAMVLNPDGTPNPLPIIDVYGTRRGPKQKPHQRSMNTTIEPVINENSMEPPQIPHPVAQIPVPIAQHQPLAAMASFMNFAAAQNQMPFPYPFLSGAFGNQLLLAQQLAAQNAAEDGNSSNASQSPVVQIPEDESESALDLSKPEVTKVTKPKIPSGSSTSSHRRKGKAFKLVIPEKSDDDEEEEEEVEEDHKMAEEEKEKEKEKEKEEIAAPVGVNAAPVGVNAAPAVPVGVTATPASVGGVPKDEDCTCKYCGIAFGDAVLYTMHMGYHGYQDAFTCNMCGEQCNDKVSFFLHIARNPHT